MLHDWAYVKRKAVGGDPAADLYSYRGNLLILNPHARVRGKPATLHAKFRQRQNKRFLYLPKEPVKVFPMLGQIENRISDELPRSVVRNIPTSINLMHRNTKLLQLFSR